jgi:PHD/YefM family antitoxin component YafN of YafNO toxin-antitoxin module
MIDAPGKVLLISHLREVLGYACKQVALTGEPIIVQRYNRQEVVIAPLADWRYYQEMEANLREAADASDDGVEEIFDGQDDP